MVTSSLCILIQILFNPSKMGTLQRLPGMVLFLIVLAWSHSTSTVQCERNHDHNHDHAHARDRDRNEYRILVDDLSNKYKSVSMQTINGTGSFHLISTNKDGTTNTISRVGMTMVKKALSVKQRTANEYEVTYEDDVKLFFSALEIQGQGLRLQLNWTGPPSQRFQDCLRLGEAHWYGGPQQKYQYWPIEKSQFNEYSYVTKEADNCAISEPYWLSSEGAYIYADSRVPLFVDQNHQEANSVCFIAEVKPPYSERRTKSALLYTIVFMDDAKAAHQHAIKNHLGKPSGQPDFRMIQHPIWSTWALYKRDIDENKIRSFAGQILDHNFNNSQLEIDDSWETCYGSLTVDETRFPNFKQLNLDLKKMGFRVTLWIHPFINKGCEPYYSEALAKSYLVTSESGKVDTDWWNSNNTKSSYVDFTNPAARDWWLSRLRKAQHSYAIDSFKFDAGETSWSPQIPLQTGDENEHPSHITRDYVKAVAQFGSLVEVRTGQRTQDLPIFVRMIDKDTYWTFQNGLPTLVTTLLQMNMNGYPLVLPDMVGGNGYNEPPSKELFIRWLQANVFMPSIQFSYVPWLFDEETVEICKKFTELHEQYAPSIELAFRRSVEVGAPANPPIWWLDPHDNEALKIWDEYLLGEEILVAPVMKQGALERDVYLPKGLWLAEGDASRQMKGGRWYRNFPAPLDSLPYFTRQQQT